MQMINGMLFKTGFQIISSSITTFLKPKSSIKIFLSNFAKTYLKSYFCYISCGKILWKLFLEKTGIKKQLFRSPTEIKLH